MMAEANLGTEAQIPISCQLCENKLTVKWKCEECVLFMCHNCKEKIHSKFKSANDHYVACICESTPDEDEVRLVLETVACSSHEKHVCCLFCRDCNYLVCPLCIARDHKNHDLGECDEVLAEQMEKLGHLEHKIDNELNSSLENESKVFNRLKVDDTTRCDEVKSKITRQSNRVKEHVDEYMQYMLQKLESVQKRNAELFMADETRIQTIQSNVKTWRETLISSRKCKNLNEIVSSISRVDMEVGKIDSKSKLELLLKMEFEPGVIDAERFSEMFGTVDFSQFEIPPDETGIFQTVVTHIKHVTNLPSVHRIKVSNDVMWFSNNITKALIKATMKDESLIVKERKEMTIFDMELSKNGELLCTTCQSPYLELLTIKGKREKIFDPSPLISLSVHISEDENIFLGARERGPPFPVTNSSIRQVIVFGINEKIPRKIYEFDKDGKRLFSYPRRIRTMEHGKILVLDTVNESSEPNGKDGRLVCFSQHSEVKFVYNGEISTEQTFWPLDIALTKSGHILVVDGKNEAIHMLNTCGVLLCVQDMSDLRIAHPTCIAIDRNGLCFIGCRSDDDNAEIHVVKCSQ